jgi:hypothetical protein
MEDALAEDASSLTQWLREVERDAVVAAHGESCACYAA